jgi:hypothetical protein
LNRSFVIGMAMLCSSSVVLLASTVYHVLFMQDALGELAEGVRVLEESDTNSGRAAHEAPERRLRREESRRSAPPQSAYSNPGGPTSPCDVQCRPECTQ